MLNCIEDNEVLDLLRINGLEYAENDIATYGIPYNNKALYKLGETEYQKQFSASSRFSKYMLDTHNASKYAPTLCSQIANAFP